MGLCQDAHFWRGVRSNHVEQFSVHLSGRSPIFRYRLFVGVND